jgi:cyanate permease
MITKLSPAVACSTPATWSSILARRTMLLDQRSSRASHTSGVNVPHMPCQMVGTLMLSALAGGAVGPWFMGFVHDRTGDYTLAFWVAIGFSALSALAIWRAAPSGVRVVAGRVRADEPA